MNDLFTRSVLGGRKPRQVTQTVLRSMLPADPPVSVSGGSTQAWLTCPVFLPSDLLPPNYSKAQLDEWYSSLDSLNSSFGEWGLRDFPRGLSGTQFK